MILCGVDGCPRGWVFALKRGVEIHVGAVKSLRRILSFSDLVVIDIPIGLLHKPRRIGERKTTMRLCDEMIRKIVGTPSSVIPPPTLEMLKERNYRDIKRKYGIGVPKQMYLLFPKIREARELFGRFKNTLREGHPEVSFTLMKGDKLHSKHTETGILERKKLLERYLANFRWDDIEVNFKMDDVFDALALLWTAQRIISGEAVEFGEGEDVQGIPMIIHV